MVDHTMAEGGGVNTQDFIAHRADLAEKEARIMKQIRQLHEEMDHIGKGDGSGGCLLGESR